MNVRDPSPKISDISGLPIIPTYYNYRLWYLMQFIKVSNISTLALNMYTTTALYTTLPLVSHIVFLESETRDTHIYPKYRDKS